MDSCAVVDWVIELLWTPGRVSYRACGREREG
jgi:hypothetical protein